MPIKSLFSEPFDDGILFKLNIFSDYFKEWLPVFISSEKPIWRKVQIFDLFAGMGKDENAVDGSPLIIINEINKWKTLIQNNKIEIKIIFNEFETKYFEALEANTKEIADLNVYSVSLYNKDFKSIFDEFYSSMKTTANFLFLDQNGIRQITEEVFRDIVELKQTDFFFFISSSFIKRFADSESFQKYLKIAKQNSHSQNSIAILQKFNTRQQKILCRPFLD